MYRPKKETRARITVELIPALEENAIKEGAVFRDIAGTDALCLVARDFKDDRVYHAKGSVNALRDIDAVMSELVLHDLILIEKRLERIAEGRKRAKDEQGQKEEPVFIKMKEHLEKDLPLRTMDLGAEEYKAPYRLFLHNHETDDHRPERGGGGHRRHVPYGKNK